MNSVPQKHLQVLVKGAAELFILSELERKPSSGKELMNKMGFVTGNKWHPSPGTIYPTLKRLELKKLILPHLTGTGRRSITYELTLSGRKALTAERKKFHNSYNLGMPIIVSLRMRMLYDFNDEEINALHLIIAEALKNKKKNRVHAPKKAAFKKFVKAWVDLL